MEPGHPLPCGTSALERTRIRLQAGLGILIVARALAEAGRSLDLGGLPHEIGAICAAALDLDPEHGSGIRNELAALLDALDGLAQAICRTDPVST